MSRSSTTEREGHRLIQFGMLMFLLSLFVGLAVSRFASGAAIFAIPRAGLAAHLIGLMQGTFLIAVGTLWPRLNLTPALSRAAFWLILYGFIAAWTVNVLAGVWGAGGAMLPNAAGQAHGSVFSGARDRNWLADGRDVASRCVSNHPVGPATICDSEFQQMSTHEQVQFEV